MRTLILIVSTLFFTISTQALAGPTIPTTCFCEFEGVIPDGLGLVDPTTCQNTESTSYERERLGQGAYSETLSFAGGIGQACGTMQVAKIKDGNQTTFTCKIWIQESRSSDTEACEIIIPGDRAINDLQISRRNLRACQRLLDDVAEEVLALPSCSAP